MQLQYIGARYVPVWYENTDDQTANWQPNVEYEPLTFVTTTNNHLYLSKKTVPDNIGNPADHTEYWLDLGVFITGQYELLQQQIDDMKDGDVSGSLQNQINELEEYEEDNFAVYLGNSYAQGVGSTSGTDGIYAKTKHLFKGSKLYADGGVGFLTYTNHTVTFENLIDQCITDSTVDKSKVTDIIILCAWGDNSALVERGDSNYDSALNSALSSLKTKISNNFTNPRLKLRVALVECREHKTIYNTAIGASYYRSVFNEHKHLADILSRNNICYLGWIGFNAMMRSGYCSSDYYHPSDLGYNVISAGLENALKGQFEYEPISSYFAYKCPGFNNPNGGGSAQITQTPYQSHVIFDPFTSIEGSTPAQYTEATWFVYDSDDETLPIPVKLESSPINIGLIEIFSAARANSIAINGSIYVNNYGQIYIKGQTFDPPIQFSDRQNNSTSMKEFTFDHYK